MCKICHGSRRWKFLGDDGPESPHPIQTSPTSPALDKNAAKRKIKEAAPTSAKRQRGSDAQTDWVVKNTRLVKQLEVHLPILEEM